MPAPAQSTYGTAYYTSSNDYVGADSFQWRVFDGVASSGVATVSITVNAVPPVPQDQTAGVKKNTTTDIPASYTGGGGYTYTLGVVSGPRHGSVVVDGRIFRYTPAMDYVGKDAFDWRMTYGTNVSATARCTIWVKEAPAVSNEWPQFRYDEWRDAVTVDGLPETLYLQWRRELPPGKPIEIPSQYDKGVSKIDSAVYMPVVIGQTLLVGFNRNDCIVAYDTRTGVEKWRYLLNGPVRVAPVAFRANGEERVCVGSDDGWVYCLGVNDGLLRWKVRAGPNERKMFGDGRMISVWPVRGAPTYTGGKIIFAGGLWPVEGCFLCAVDPASGEKVWLNEGLGNIPVIVSGKSCSTGYGTGYPGSMGLVGLMPAGYPVRCRNYTDQFYLPSGMVKLPRFSVLDGKWQEELLDNEVLLPYRSTWRRTADGGYWGNDYSEDPTITAGVRSYTASDAASLGVVGTVLNMVAADSRLFAVAMQQGSICSIYCFGGTRVDTPAVYTNSYTPLPVVNDAWTTNIATILAQSGVNDNGMGMVWGLGSGRAMEELVKQSSLHVIGVESNAGTVATMRMKLINAGLYGERCAVLESDPLKLDMPPWQVRVLVVEDLIGAGFPGSGSGVEFVKKLFHVIRPYGGRAWLPTSSEQHSAFQGWVTSAGLTNATVLRFGEWTVLERTGPLPGTIDYTSANGTITNSDQLVKSPFAVSWYGNYPAMETSEIAPDVISGRIIEAEGRIIDVYTGIRQKATGTHSGAKTVSAPLPRKLTNPLFGTGSGKAFSGGQNYGIIHSAGVVSFNCGYWTDYSADMGAVIFGGLGSTCVNVGGSTYGTQDGPGSMIPANGMYMWALVNSGCTCATAVKQAVGLYHRDDVEAWTTYSRMNERTTALVEERPVRKVGINFGAPGSRMSEDDILWLEVPRHQPGPSPTVVTFVTPAEAVPYYHHSALITGDNNRKWVAASGIKGANKVEILTTHVMVALPTATPPVIDGEITDACWDGKWASKLLWDQKMGCFPLGDIHGIIMMRYDEENLYVMMKCPYILNWLRPWDRFELEVWDREHSRIENSDMNKTVRFAVQMDGTKVVTGDMVMGEWTNSWSAASSTNGGVLRCEMAIPWSTLSAIGLWKNNLIVNAQWNGYIPYGASYSMKLRQTGYVPLYLGGLRGLGGLNRPYNVKLYFAETEGCSAGQRVFHVDMQGKRVLSNLDVCTEAGGPGRVLVKEFSNIEIADRLTIELNSVKGETILSGVELVGTWDDSDYPNHPPVAVIRADVTNGVTPLEVNFSAWDSYDPDGQIVECRWNFDDGTIKRGSRVRHVFTEPGDYDVTLLVVDNAGGAGSVSMRISVGAGVPAAFVCKIRANPVMGDYTNLSSWAEAMVSDLTSTTRVFTVSSMGAYTNTYNGRLVRFTGGGTGLLMWVNTNATPIEAGIAKCSGTIEPGDVVLASGSMTNALFTVADTGVDTRSLLFSVTDRMTYNRAVDNGTKVVFTGGGIGRLKHINTENIAYITECRGTIVAGEVTCASGNKFRISGDGHPVYVVVAEGYNDWPKGLTNTVTLSGWLTDDEHTVLIRAAQGEGHAGILKKPNGDYAGFAVRGSASHPYPVIIDNIGNVRVRGIIVTTALQLDGKNGSIDRVINFGGYYTRIAAGGTIANTLAINTSYGICPIPNQGPTSNVMIVNCTAVGSGFSPNWGNGRVWFVNCLAQSSNGFTNNSSSLTIYNVACASSDGTADDMEGLIDGCEDGCDGNKTNRVFTFVNPVSNDYRLAATDSGARALATSGFGKDIEGQLRTPPYDIGADAAPYSGDFDGDGIPDEIDPDDDNDGLPDWWEVANGLNPFSAGDAGGDFDRDGLSNLQEYIAGTDPWDGRSRFSVGVYPLGNEMVIWFDSISGRLYTVEYCSNLLDQSGWHVLTNGIYSISGGRVEVIDPAEVKQRFYRLKVRLP
jgi:PKD repeat protein